nr:insulin receptor [Lasioderma serricorne]
MYCSYHTVLAIFALVTVTPTVHAKICYNVEIKSNLDDIDKLVNCTVVVGYLRITLLETTTAGLLDASFPELSEIRGYLLLYRVFGISTLSHLFPNLVVIGGEELFENYALILYETTLTEIGLFKLSKIVRGAVRIERCDQICFVDTVDWSKIGGKLHYFNNTVQMCQKCPESCTSGHCWNTDHCQIEISNCHPECIGCSQAHSASHCYACVNYKDKNRCVTKCPENKYPHHATKECITASECSSKHENGEWWVFGGECINACPQNYQRVSKAKGYCQRCEGRCVRICEATVVNSISAAQSLTGCTHINGSLHLHITDQSVAGELEHSLDHIEQISGYLKVAFSTALTNLTFFSNLRVINGTSLENRRYAIYIVDNNNLHKLWDLDHSNLTIMNGTVGIHYNPKLCRTEINKLTKVLGLKNLTAEEVSPYSNGQSVWCVSARLKMKLIERNPTNVTITWDDLSADNKLIGYFLYYMETREGNISNHTLTESNNDECQNNKGWNSIFTTKNFQQITKLQPNTDYAYYIETYVVNNWGDRSQLQFFQTEPDDPSEPMSFTVIPISSTKIQLKWLPPDHPNGELSHYVITGYFVRDDPEFLEQRNYCREPYRLLPEKKPEQEQPSNDTSSLDCCFIEIGKAIDAQLFDHLCSSLERIGRPICDSYAYSLVDSEKQMATRRNPVSLADMSQFEIITSNASINEYLLEDLKHFSLYTIFISACNKRINGTFRCGPIVMETERTFKDENADRIPGSPSVEVNQEHVQIKWDKPRNPNSVVLAYEVLFDMIGESISPDCMTPSSYRETRHVYKRNLIPGSYSARLRAISLAGPGPLTEAKNFEIYSASKPASLLIATVAIFFIALVVIVALYFYWRRTQYDVRLIRSVNPDYTEYIADEWELERSDLEINEELGKGSFGMVCSGRLKSLNVPCAVKTVNENATAQDRVDFLNEASIMKSFSNSHHVVRLIGVVSKGDPPYVVMELMEQGDLKSYLRRSRESSNTITCAEMYRMAIEIADGMAYLSAKKFVHRDLAARNCMVAADRTVKIGDFGMTRDIYENDYYRKETRGLLPVRWMSPECLADGVFTSDSDVWSYGVVLWEMVTLAEQPYQGLSNEQVLQFVIARGTMERPPECPQILYEIMEKCWKWRPIDRPLFMDIVAKLEPSVGQDFRLISFYHSKEGEEYRLNSGQRVYNPPAVSGVIEFDTAAWNVSDEEISLYPGEEGQSKRSAPFSFQRC